MAYRCEQCLSISQHEDLCPMCNVPMREQVAAEEKKEKVEKQNSDVTAVQGETTLQEEKSTIESETQEVQADTDAKEEKEPKKID